MIGVNVGQLTVEQALVATLTRWVPSYVVAAARRYAAEGAFGLTPEAMGQLLADGELPFRPRGIAVTKDFQDWPVDALPHIQVLSPSWEAHGGDQDGMTIRYQLQAACLVGAQTAEDTRLIRACYEDAIIGIAEQQRSLGGIAAGVDLIGGGSAQFTEISGEDERTFQGSIAVMDVTVERVVNRHEGPAEPPPVDEHEVPEPPAGTPTLDEDGASVTLDPEPLGGS